jgi:hypothetical protein
LVCQVVESTSEVVHYIPSQSESVEGEYLRMLGNLRLFISGT